MASHLLRTTGALAVLVLGFALPVSCVIGPENAAGPCGDVGCDDGNPCTDDVCAEDGFCDHVPAAKPPDDGNECTVDECADLQERHTAKADGAPCGLGGLLQCEGGQCTCSEADECGVTTKCKTFACVSSACSSTNAPEGTPVDGAAAHDCKKKECDGEGEETLVPDLADFEPDPVQGNCKQNACDAAGPVVVADPTDRPADDSNECTVEACNGSTPIAGEPVPDLTPCGAPAACGPTGNGFQTIPQPACLSGACVPGAAVSCGLFACNAAGTACAGACAGDADCVAAAFCSGAACVADLGLGMPCSGNGQCASGSCADGVCCNEACDGTCKACNAAGQCQNIPVNTDPAEECPGTQVCNGSGGCVKQQGDTCNASSQCLSGFCRNGYCCDSDCPGSCRRCDLAGSLGTCGNVASGQQAGQCNGGSTCDGAGNCKFLNGTQCIGSEQCLSGFCSDEPSGARYCCNEACSGLCRSCAGSKTGGQNGTCGYILDKTDPDGECSGQCNSGNGSGCCRNNGTCY